jgi:hypothetical protein
VFDDNGLALHCGTPLSGSDSLEPLIIALSPPDTRAIAPAGTMNHSRLNMKRARSAGLEPGKLSQGYTVIGPNSPGPISGAGPTRRYSRAIRPAAIWQTGSLLAKLLQP